MSRPGAASLLVFVLSLGALGGAVAVADGAALRAPRSAAVDFLPLWLGAALVEQGHDPNDAVAAEAQFHAEQLPMHPGGFYSYYPPTAALFSLPLRPLGFPTAVAIWRVLGVCSIVVGAAFAALAGFPGLSLRAASTASLLAALAVLSRPARVVIPTGQPGPLVVLAAGVGLWALARERYRLVAGVAALGAAVKLVPAVLMLPLLRRHQQRTWIVFGVVIVGLIAVLVGFAVPLDPVGWAAALVSFVGRGENPSWRSEPVWLALWSVRVPVVTLGTLAASVFPRSRALDLAALAVAAVGVVVAGTHHYHEALVLVPAGVHALAWPVQSPKSRLAWGASGLLAALCLSQPAAFSRSGRPDSLVWVGLGLGVWMVCLLRVIRPAAPIGVTRPP